MRASRALVVLSLLLALVAGLVSGAGVFWTDQGAPFTFTTLRGETVQLLGQGIYRFDPLFGGAGTRGTDAVTLLVAVPLLLVSLYLYARGSRRGGFLLLGALAYLAYNSANMVFGVAYNNLFLLYIAYFSLSCFAFVLALISIDLNELPGYLNDRAPRRGMAWFLFIAGAIVLLAWLADIVGALVSGVVPQVLATNTTVVTYALDLGLIAPACFLAGILLLRRAPFGYVLGFALLVTCALVGLAVIGQTAFQMAAGWQFAPGQLIGMVGLWVVLALAALWFIAAFLRALRAPQTHTAVKLSPAPA